MSEVYKPKIPSNLETPWSTHDEKHVEQWGTIHKSINKTEVPLPGSKFQATSTQFYMLKRLLLLTLFWLPFTRSTCYTRSSQAHPLALYALAVSHSHLKPIIAAFSEGSAGTCKNVSTWVETCHYWGIITFVKSHRSLAQSKNCVRWVNNLKYRRQRLLTLPYMYDSRCGIPMVERPRNDVTYEKSWKCPQCKTRKSIHVLA